MVMQSIFTGITDKLEDIAVCGESSAGFFCGGTVEPVSAWTWERIS